MAHAVAVTRQRRQRQKGPLVSLVAFVQTQSDNSDSDMGAPETVVREGKSVAIADIPNGTVG